MAARVAAAAALTFLLAGALQGRPAPPRPEHEVTAQELVYNVACGFALAGQKEKALDWLERAVQAGFSERQLMETDSDLESLRGLERFQKLLEKLK
jgi:hypothetical protein